MELSADDCERVIRRKEMVRGQVTLLKYLYEADGYVPWDDVVEAIRWGDDESFVGVLSAFSNRVNSTDAVAGDPGYEAFVERREVDGAEAFRLREPARRAIERVDGLQAAFERPMEELLDNEGVPVSFEPPRITDIEAGDAGDDHRWTPDTPENRLLVGYWQDVGGVMVPEVHVGATGPGDWPAGSSKRLLDGLRFRSPYQDEITTRTSFSQAQLRDIVADRHVEVIEVKQSLGRPVIGQAIAGRDMFQRDYAPGTVEPVVVVGSGDPALEWVCRKNGVRVEIVEEAELEG